MGLSDEERLNKMVWAVNSLTLNGRKLRSMRGEDVPYHSRETRDALVELLDQVWHAYLGGDSNGIFWLLGGDFNNPVRGPGAPWSTAIIAQCEAARPSPHSDWESRRSERPFDPFDGYLDVPGLLSGAFQKTVYDTYAWTEQLSYALRRYPDEIQRRYSKLNKLISDIQGCCFDLFRRDTSYGKAYVGNRLVEALYKVEGVAEVFAQLHFHHDFGRGLKEDATLGDILAWDKWRLTHKKTPQNAFTLALRIAGRHFHYEHKLRKLIELTRGMKVRKKVLQREFEKCAKAQKEHQSTRRTRASATGRTPFAKRPP